MDLKSLVDWIRFLPHYLDWNIYGTNIGPWLVFAFVTAFTFAILTMARLVLRRVLGRMAVSTTSKLNDLLVAMIGRVKKAVLLILAICVGSLALSLTAREAEFVSFAASIAVLLQVGLWGSLVIAFTIEPRRWLGVGSTSTSLTCCCSSQLRLLS